MRPLTAVIITFNEEANIRHCLESVSFASECVVVDSSSTDRTVTIAEMCGARVLSVPWSGYARAKNAGIDAARNDWILLIDADERISPELADSILKCLDQTLGTAGYQIARRTWYMNRWIRGGGWYPDLTIRLFDRTRGRVREVPVHESVEVTGPIECLDGDILHFSYRNLSDHVQKIDKYTSLVARQWDAERRQISISMMFLRPPWEFIRKWIFRRGYRDGIPGLIIAAMHAWYVFLKYVKTYEITHHISPSENRPESDASETQ